MWGLILAAGQGRRMLPLTQARAKPSLPFKGIPIIKRIASGLSLHVDHLGVNLYHLPWEVVRALEGFPLALSLEERLLGTCGGIRRMVEAFSIKDDVIVQNGDSLFLSSYSDFIETHRRGKAPITLALCPYREGYTRVSIRDNRLVLGQGGHFYCGAMIISREILGEIPPEGNLVLDFAAHHPVQGFMAQALEFTDPTSYLEAHGNRVWVEEGAQVPPLALVEASVIMRDAVVERGAAVINSIIVRGRVPAGEFIEGKIFIDGRIYPISGK